MVHSRDSVVTEVTERINELKLAVDDVGKVRQCLRLNACDVKAQIQKIISTQLSALQSRERWLVNHADELENLKDEVLCQQASVLQRCIFDLEDCLEQAKEIDDPEDLRVYLEHALEKVSGVCLTPEENGSLGFSAEFRKMQDTIVNFGKVTTDDIFQRKVVEPFTFLPDDADGFDVIPEALELKGKSQCRLSPYCNCTGVCEEQVNTEDTMSCSSTEEHSSQSVFSLKESTYSPVLDGTCKTWLLTEALTRKDEGNKSVEVDSQMQKTLDQFKVIRKTGNQVWLAQKRGDIHSSGKEGFVSRQQELILNNWLVAREVKKEDLGTQSPGFVKFHSVSRETKSWLQNDSKVKETTYAKFSFFKRLSEKKEDWLLKRDTKSEAKPTDANGHVTVGMKRPASEAEEMKIKRSNDDMIFPQFTSIFQASLANWLRKPSSETESDKQPESYSPWLTRRNSSASGISSVVQKLSAMELFDNNIWLRPSSPSSRKESMSSSSVSSNLSGVLEHFNTIARSESSRWLKPTSSGTVSPSDLDKVLNHFKAIQSSDCNRWLRRQSNATMKYDRNDDICQWLAGRSNQRCEDCPGSCSYGLFDSLKDTKSAGQGWLLKIPKW